MRTVPLGGKKAAGRVALVDDGDYGLVMAHRWFVLEGNRPRRRSIAYAATNMPHPRRGTLRMHNLILGCIGIDHHNGNGLDNQRANLRPATGAQNAANRRPREHTSCFKGIGWERSSRKWRARIDTGGQQHYLGLFACEEDAARAYDAAAVVAFGEFARLNFPPPSGASDPQEDPW
jgi:hypothetical protein